MLIISQNTTLNYLASDLTEHVCFKTVSVNPNMILNCIIIKFCKIHSYC